MRYILLVLLAFVTTFASAQVQFLGSPTTTVRNRGNFVSDSLFYLPKRTKAPSDTGALRYQISDSALYVWTGSAWRSTGTAGSAITGSGVAGYMPEFTTSTNIDTTRLYHSAGRFAIGSTTTTNGVFNVIGGTTYLEGNLSFGAADRTISNISNNVLAFGTNNTERMRIGANGDVAIGTTNADPFTRGDDRRIAMDASGISSTANVALSLNAGSSAGRGAQLYLGVGGTRHFEISSNSVEQGISAISNTYIKFLTNNTERMRLKADGEVLIGTTTDAGAYALQVAGSIYNTTGYWTGSSGQLGIGVTSSSYPMEIIKDGNSVGIGNSIISIRGSGGDDQRLHFGYNGTNVSLIAAARTLAFTRYDLVADGWRESMRINNTGELLIGTTSDAGTYALQVTGAIYNTTTITTGAPSGGTAKPFKIGAAATVSPTSPNRTIEIEIDGTTYYLHAKTTND